MDALERKLFFEVRDCSAAQPDAATVGDERGRSALRPYANVIV